MTKVLIVEDQPAVAKALRMLLDLHDIEAQGTADPDAAVRLLEAHEIDLVLQDMNFTPGATSGEEGIALFRRLRAADPDVPVLLLTAWTSLETAVQLVKEGASDYLAKPWDDAKLVATVRNLLHIRELRVENDRLRNEKRRTRQALARESDLCGIVYESEAMHRVVTLAVQIAISDVPVLITGANGAGKEMIAEIIHANSRRNRAPLVKVNAGAIPDELIESELFGAEAGAYTGSQRLRLGRFEAAHNGTLFLDEIGNLSLSGQMKLLRVLQSG
ncbi:MAG TPA: sigma 54-interacting transcriptional regulator, partial [Thermoanaerobaculia bacterium]